MSRTSLERFAIFSELNERSKSDLQSLLRYVTYRTGDLIFQEGGPSAGLYLILSGLVQYGKLSGRRHRRRILKLLGAGETFGEEALFNSEICSCPGYARAITDTSLAFIEKHAFLSFIERHPQVMIHLCGWLTRQLKVFECKLVELAYEPLEQNLLRLLLILMERFGVRDAQGVRIDAPLSRQELADLLGAHLDTVIHELSRLRDQGLISVKDHQIIIKDPENLKELVEPQTTCSEEKLF
jgi:CRP/FNR family transcriptional regulator